MADFDRDGLPDLVVYRPSDSTWHASLSGTDFATLRTWQLGAPGDQPVPGDYTGDDWDDIAVYRPSDATWHVWSSETDFADPPRTWQWGFPTDVPVI